MGTESILLVDDNQSLLEVTRRNLTAWGYKVIAVARGRMALAILESGEPIDLLFTDVVMPEAMSGPELVDAARRVDPHLKVLFTTGYVVEPSDYQRGITCCVSLMTGAPWATQSELYWMMS